MPIQSPGMAIILNPFTTQNSERPTINKVNGGDNSRPKNFNNISLRSCLIKDTYSTQISSPFVPFGKDFILLRNFTFKGDVSNISEVASWTRSWKAKIYRASRKRGPRSIALCRWTHSTEVLMARGLLDTSTTTSAMAPPVSRLTTSTTSSPSTLIVIYCRAWAAARRCLAPVS